MPDQIADMAIYHWPLYQRPDRDPALGRSEFADQYLWTEPELIGSVGMALARPRRVDPNAIATTVFVLWNGLAGIWTFCHRHRVLGSGA